MGIVTERIAVLLASMWIQLVKSALLTVQIASLKPNAHPALLASHWAQLDSIQAKLCSIAHKFVEMVVDLRMSAMMATRRMEMGAQISAKWKRDSHAKGRQLPNQAPAQKQAKTKQ